MSHAPPPHPRPALRQRAVRHPAAAIILSPGQMVQIGGQVYQVGSGPVLLPQPVPLPSLRPTYLQLEVPAGSVITARVTLAQAAPVDSSVRLTYLPPITGAPAQVTVPAGATWARFTFPVPTTVPAYQRQEIDATLSGVTLPLSWFYTVAVVPPPTPAQPVVTGYADRFLHPLASGTSVSGELVILGSGFGAKSGTVTYAGIPCSSIYWSDSKVIVMLPVSAMTSFEGPAGPPPASGSVCVTRPDGSQGCGPVLSPWAAAAIQEKSSRR